MSIACSRTIIPVRQSARLGLAFWIVEYLTPNSVLKKITRGAHGDLEDMLQPGRRQVSGGRNRSAISTTA